MDTHLHDHEHEHEHEHASPQPDDKVRHYHQILGTALVELLIEKSVIMAAELRAGIAARDAITPALGAKVVARAWVDAGFRQRLLADANSALTELGIGVQAMRLVALENTPQLHNVVVCTLCSCYPRDLLGLPPSWYKSRSYRARVVHQPREVLAEFGTELPAGTAIRVHDSTADIRYLVLPMRPPGTDGLDEAALAELVGRDGMIGVAAI